MKAIIQKDLRENLKVALIGLLIFSLMLLQAYQACIAALTDLLTRNYSVQASTLQPLLATTLLTEAAFFCAIFGAALGWLQTRNEAHRDLWAFLIHRPVTRTEIFQGKAIAGLCLYVFGAGLPLVVLVGVVRMPGHVAAPFEWAMVMPLVLIFLTGVGFYFAGVLTGLRQARWFASRSFGLALAIASSASVFAATEFWQSLVLIVVVVVILATAVWGAYQSGGFYRGQPMIGRLALTVAMTAGCGAVLFIGLGLVFTLIVNPLSHHSSVSSYYQMTRDGIIYKETLRDGELVEIADLDGHPLLDPKTGQHMEQKEFSQRIAYGGTVVTTLKNRYQGGNVLQNPAQFFNLWNITDKTIWYLDRHGKLTGYDGRTRKSVGSLEPHGYDGTLVSEPFLNQPNFYYNYNSYNDTPQKLIATAKSVYQVDFKTRALKPVFTLTNDDEIGGYAGIGIYVDANGSKQSLLFTTRKTVQLLDYEGHPIFAMPYQPGYFEYPQIQLSILAQTKSQTNNVTVWSTNNFAVWFYPDFELNRKAGWKMPTHVQWLGPEQTVSRNANLPALHQDEESSLPDKLATAFLPPPAHVTFSKKIYSAWNLFSYGLALICATIGWTLARRYNFSTKAGVGWTSFIFLLGIPGLLTFLCVQEWPVREACPNCKKLRAVDREFCEHCQAPFSPPEKNGTEIFEPLLKT
jgi:ABC-type transport system involved in multi-copper enzyme maturation permease subunit